MKMACILVTFHSHTLDKPSVGAVSRSGNTAIAFFVLERPIEYLSTNKYMWYKCEGINHTSDTTVKRWNHDVQRLL